MKKYGLFILVVLSLLMVACANNKECTIECDDVNMALGATYKLEPKTNIKNPKFNYIVDSSVIEINNGEIISKEVGSAIVKITVEGQDAFTEIMVNVYNEGINIIAATTDIVIEQSIQLELVFFEADEDSKIVWKSSNNDIARVSKGKVTGINFGEVTISAENDVYKASIVLKIIPPKPEYIEVNLGDTLELGATYELDFDVFPKYALDEVIITSSNDVVTINKEENTFTCVKEGNGVLSFVAKEDNEVKLEKAFTVVGSECPKFVCDETYEDNIDVSYADSNALLKGIKVIDNVDGDITENITFDETLLQSYGTKTITLSVKDEAGNTSTLDRTVNIVWNYHTKFIGHAGCTYAVTNTEEAFLYAAKELHYQALECDLQMTKDGIYVTNHDSSINGVSIADTKYEDLVKLVITENNHTGHVCTLERYLEICKEYGCEAIIEFKGSTPGLSDYSQTRVPEVLAYVDERIGLENVVFLTSVKKLLIECRKQNANVRLQYLVDSCDSQDVLDFCIKYNCDLSTNVTYGGTNSDEWLVKYHEAGLEISTWTFSKDYDQVQEWIDKGVEYVTCDWQEMDKLNLK